MLLHERLKFMKRKEETKKQKKGKRYGAVTFHASPGYDLTVRFCGFSKITCFDTFIKSNLCIQKAFATVENNNIVLKEENS